MRILTTLGWNQFDANEVIPEYDVGGTRVDYALSTDGTNKVLLEAKRAGESLEHHQEQLLGYAFRHGVELAVLTNGLTWWMYLPMRGQESWEQRRFCIIDVQDNDVQASADRFVEFLSRSRVHDGSAVQDATSRLDTLRRESEILDALPKAWSSLIAEKDDLLVELIDEKVEELLGFRPGTEPIHRFLGDLVATMSSETRHRPPAAPATPSSHHRGHRSTPRSTTSAELVRALQGGRRGLSGFTFDGESFSVHQWKSLVQTLAEVLYRRHPTEFGKVETLRGTKRTYFSSNYADLDEPREVKGTHYFVETKWGWKQSIDLCHRLLHLFGYDEQDLKIDFN